MGEFSSWAVKRATQNLVIYNLCVLVNPTVLILNQHCDNRSDNRESTPQRHTARNPSREWCSLALVNFCNPYTR